MCAYDHTKNRMWSHVGEDSVYEMIIELLALADDECIENTTKSHEMVTIEHDQADFEHTTCCYIRQREFNEKDKRARDHDHRTGCYCGAAHDRCNILEFSNRFLPVIFHNLKGYDSNLIIEQPSRLTII